MAGWVFVCERSNDLWRVAEANGLAVIRCGSAEEAAGIAGGRPVLLLADGYPERTQPTALAAVEALLAAGSRVYLEYPTRWVDAAPDEPAQAPWTRGVVCSGFLGDGAPEGAIVTLNGCRYLTYTGEGEPLLTLAKVAGYDTATFGLPGEHHPLLVSEREGRLLVATTGLSSFVRGRFGPQRSWEAIWSRVLGYLAGEAGGPGLSWMATVRPSYDATEELPPDAEMEALRRGARWFERSRLLVSREALPLLAPAMSRGEEEVPNLPRSVPVGDGSLGMLEGFSAHIRPDGSQPTRCVIRNDCLGESAMGLALAAAVTGEERDSAVARNLLDYMCFDSLIQQGIRADRQHPAYGLMSWGVTSFAWERATYGDDNARALLGMLAASVALGDTRWDASILRCLLADLRTTGPLGFRGDRIDMPDLEANGWGVYHDREIVNPSPHYEGYLWAAYLLAYRLTGHEEFLEKPRRALTYLMERYPEGVGTVYGTTLEYARLLLPLAWLVRIDDTPVHREWLHRVARDLLAEQDEFGTIREHIGFPGRERRYAVDSNEAFGTAETLVLQENGDPASDLLYTVNFAFLGLHEAYAATGEPWLREAEDKMAGFLCRAQVRSEAHPELDGAWYRGFDSEKWEYWGSSADMGWGVWSVETGWTQGWIVGVLALRRLGRSLWETAGHSDAGRLLPTILPEFESDRGPYRPTPVPIATLAGGASYEVTPAPDGRYPGSGKDLTDGLVWGVGAWRSWPGWLATPLTVTVDLGEERQIAEAGIRYLSHTDMGIFPPARLTVRTSRDGRSYSPATGQRLPEVAPGERGMAAHDALVDVGELARFVRLEVTPLAAIPSWHSHAGEQAWVFIDEALAR